MTRRAYIERFLIQIYGGLPEDDAEMTYDLINAWLTDGIASAAKQSYKESIQIEGIGYVNNSFYTTFSGLAVVSDDTDNQCYKITLPEVPLGIGRNEGVSTLKFKDENGNVSLTAIPLSINQQAYADSMKPIPNKILYWPEGNTLRAKSSLMLSQFSAVIKMISGGDATNLDSELNVPPDYLPIIQEYLKAQLGFEKVQKPDLVNDGNDLPT